MKNQENIKIGKHFLTTLFPVISLSSGYSGGSGWGWEVGVGGVGENGGGKMETALFEQQ